MAELATNVAQVLESNQEIFRRMARLEQQSFRVLPSAALTITGRDATPAPSSAESSTVDDTESIMTVRGPVTDAQNTKGSDQRQVFGYSFDQDLNTSRPYTRAMQKHGVWSTTSSEIHTMGWSCLSGLSLAEISHISVINLPFSPQDLWNGHRYSETRIEPVAAKSMLILGKSTYESRENFAVTLVLNYSHLSGGPDSGKTTVFNHLQILYGNGITELERLTASEFIMRNLVDLFIDAWPIWSDSYDRDRQKTGGKVRDPVTYFVLC